MIVAATNHLGTTSGDSLPARTIMPWERARDMVVVPDQLGRAPPGEIVPDMDRVAALGFSLGGRTVPRVLGTQPSKDAFVACCDGGDARNCGRLGRGGVGFDAIEAPVPVVRLGAEERSTRRWRPGTWWTPCRTRAAPSWRAHGASAPCRSKSPCRLKSSPR